MSTQRSNSFFLSSLGKKYFMALTGLFLCVFLVGHVSGNLQLLIPGYAGRLQFNEYAVFMTTFPAVKVLSYLTYFSILFHVVDGIALTIQNRKARPVNYAYSKPSANTQLPSRIMPLLGVGILLFLIMHMTQFWAAYKWGNDFPTMTTENGASPILMDGTVVEGGVVRDFVVYNAAGEEVGPVMKDLYEVVAQAFSQPLFVILYILGLGILAMHLWHGFAAGFNSLGLSHPVYTPIIKKTGYAFAVIVPILFAIIPVVMFVVVK